MATLGRPRRKAFDDDDDFDLVAGLFDWCRRMTDTTGEQNYIYRVRIISFDKIEASKMG